MRQQMSENVQWVEIARVKITDDIRSSPARELESVFQILDLNFRNKRLGICRFKDKILLLENTSHGVEVRADVEWHVFYSPSLTRVINFINTLSSYLRQDVATAKDGSEFVLKRRIE